jgi:cytoskeletal protein CcmA (bactofilin family)
VSIRETDRTVPSSTSTRGASARAGPARARRASGRTLSSRRTFPNPRARSRRYTDPESNKGDTLAIFGKTDPPAAAPRETAPSNGPSAPTVVGAQSRITGDIFGDEDVLIHGRVEGKIQIDRLATIGPTGDVRGDVTAGAVVVAGRIEGQIVARQRAELLASATVTGSVQAPKVVIAEGAQLQGSVTMSSPASAGEKASETTS